MKKLMYMACIMGGGGIFLMNCQNESGVSTPTQTVETNKSITMKNFDGALQRIAKGGTAYIDQDKQLNQEGIDILLPMAKQLIAESKIPESDLRGKTDKEIINLGFSVYHENIQKYKTTIKANF